MKIVYLDEAAVNLDGDIDYSTLKKLGNLTCHASTKSDREAIDRLQSAEVLLTNKYPISEKLIAQLPGLKHVAETATGFNNIYIDACKRAGVSVSNVPGYSTDSVAQHVFTMILNLATRIHNYDADIRNGEWGKSDVFTLLKYPTFELKGKTLGVVGFGAIGKEVARIGQAFGMNVLVNRKSQKHEGGFVLVSMDELLEQSDVISLCCPLTKENKYMIDETALKKMKPNALLINTARGALVNQADLATALNEGQIGGAGIDVLDEEPPKDNPLLGEVKNLILSPHSAWSTREARQRLIDEVALNVEAFAKGEKRNWVS